MDETSKNLHDLDISDITMVISSAGRTVCQASWWGRENEWSKTAKLYLPVQGLGWVRIRGRLYSLRTGRLYLIPPLAELSFGTPEEVTIEWIHFQPRSIVLHSRLAALPGVHEFGKSAVARWAHVCRLIEPYTRERSLSHRCLLESMLLELVGTILPRLPEEDPAKRIAYERLLPAMEILNSPETKSISLRDLARAAALSPEYFHRLFRELFQTTPFRYTHARRMNLALKLLSEDRFSVAGTATECGYEDAFYFSRVFRRHFGFAPSDVRRGNITSPTP